MIEPVLSGSPLAEQIAGGAPGEERLALWWMGQSGFLLRRGDLVVGFDLYLSNYLAATRPGPGRAYDRQTRAPLRPDELTCLDLLVVSGSQPDHLDPDSVGALLAASPRALLLLPASLADFAADELDVPDERLVPIADREFFDLDGLRLQAIAASADADAGPLAYVLQIDPLSVLLVGQSEPYDGFAERLATFAPALALLPISGRGARLQQLGAEGSLTAVEAARLADESGAQVVVPHHFDMFALHHADVGAFCEHTRHHYPRLKTKVLEPGGRWLFPGERRD
jgi:L-ascorbate metabolism protein UlaG (beta-lactamase superfamily)